MAKNGCDNKLCKVWLGDAPGCIQNMIVSESVWINEIAAIWSKKKTLQKRGRYLKVENAESHD